MPGSPSSYSRNKPSFLKMELELGQWEKKLVTVQYSRPRSSASFSFTILGGAPLYNLNSCSNTGIA